MNPSANAGPDVILASASPRRRELLERVGLRLQIAAPEIDETPRAGETAGDYVRRMAADKLAKAVRARAAAAESSMATSSAESAASTGSTAAGSSASAASVESATSSAATSSAATSSAAAESATSAGSAAAASAAPLPILAADTIVILRGAILGKPRDEADARAMLRELSGHRHEVTTAFRIAFGSRQADRAVTTTVVFRLIDPAELEAYVAGGEWRGKAGGYAVQGVAAAFVTELRGSPTNVIGLPLPEVLADLRALGALPSYPPPWYPTVA